MEDSDSEGPRLVDRACGDDLLEAPVDAATQTTTTTSDLNSALPSTLASLWSSPASTPSSPASTPSPPKENLLCRIGPYCHLPEIRYDHVFASTATPSLTGLARRRRIIEDYKEKYGVCPSRGFVNEEFLKLP